MSRNTVKFNYDNKPFLASRETYRVVREYFSDGSAPVGTVVRMIGPDIETIGRHGTQGMATFCRDSETEATFIGIPLAAVERAKPIADLLKETKDAIEDAIAKWEASTSGTGDWKSDLVASQAAYLRPWLDIDDPQVLIEERRDLIGQIYVSASTSTTVMGETPEAFAIMESFEELSAEWERAVKVERATPDALPEHIREANF